jgi:hypothetical protein
MRPQSIAQYADHSTSFLSSIFYSLPTKQQQSLDPTTLATCFCSSISSLPTLSGCTTCLDSNGVPSLATSLGSLPEVCTTLEQGLGSMTMTLSESGTVESTASSTGTGQDGEGVSTMTDSAGPAEGTGSGDGSGEITSTGKYRRISYGSNSLDCD